MIITERNKTMSYRTYVNHIQIFGNNEYYPEWLDFVKSQGIDVDEQGTYEGNITDFMGAVSTIESIVKRLHEERETLRERIPNTTKKCLFNLSYIPRRMDKQNESESKFQSSLLDELIEATENAYCFLPYTFYMACKDALEPDKPFTEPDHFRCWKLKPESEIHICAY